MINPECFGTGFLKSNRYWPPCSTCNVVADCNRLGNTFMNAHTCKTCKYLDYIIFCDPYFDNRMCACNKSGNKIAIETRAYDKYKVDGCSDWEGKL